MKKADLMNLIQSTYLDWEQISSRIPRDKMEIPGAAGEWSLKDVVAHITWGEREMVGVLRTRTFAGSPLWNLDTDARNQIVFEENKGHTLEDVISDSQRVHADLLAELEKIEDLDLVDSSRIQDLPPDWQLWQVLAGNTFEHYEEHTEYLRASGLLDESEEGE